MDNECTGRCSGCALTKGAKANVEIGNRSVALLAALGGLPFYCHEQMGWTPEKEGYPATLVRITNALDNLMTAPKLIHNSPEIAAAESDATECGLPAELFAEDRALIGRTPVCGGWKRAVAKLAAEGWFTNHDTRKTLRKMASAAIKAVDQLKAEKDPGKRKEALNLIGAAFKSFRTAQIDVLGKIVRLEEDSHA